MAVKKYTNVPSTAQNDPSYTFVGDDYFGQPAPAREMDWFDPAYGYAAPGDVGPSPVYGAPTPSARPSIGNLVASTQYGRGGGTDFAALGIGQVGDDGKYVPTAGIGGISRGGGGGGGYKPSVGRVTTSRTTFTGDMPEAPQMREMDKRRVKALTQKAMAPRLRLLRSALSRALVRSYENPNVRRMIVREALQGYGQGVETARAGAEAGARREEAMEREVSNKNLMLAYQHAMEAYRSTAVTTQTSRELFDTEEARLAAGEEGGGGVWGAPSGGASRRKAYGSDFARVRAASMI